MKSDDEIAADAGESRRRPKALADATLGGPERVTAMSSNWADPAPRNGVVVVKLAPLANGLELEAPFAAPAPAAVFARGSAVWAVFAANADLKIDQTQLPAGYRVRTMRAKNATILRLETPKGLTVSAEMDRNRAGRIRIAPSATKPQRFLKPERKSGDGGRARIETMLIGATGLVWFEDPVIGDQLAAAVSYGPSSASPTPRDFVEASLPATAHGLAIAPKSDDVGVTIEGERVVVSMARQAPDDAGYTGGQQIRTAESRRQPRLHRLRSWGQRAARSTSSSSPGSKPSPRSSIPQPPRAARRCSILLASISATRWPTKRSAF